MVFPPGAAESEGPDGFLFDRADRKSQDLGDLGLGKAIDTVQEEDSVEFRGGNALSAASRACSL